MLAIIKPNNAHKKMAKAPGIGRNKRITYKTTVDGMSIPGFIYNFQLPVLFICF
jgi:hypothetical protein